MTNKANICFETDITKRIYENKSPDGLVGVVLWTDADVNAAIRDTS